MLTFKSIQLDNVVYFDHAELDLDWHGTTFVSGINRNAKADDRRNGVGKSLLLSPLAHLAFGDPTGLSRTLSRHSLLTEKDSRIEWTLGAQDSDWTIAKQRRGKRIEWSVLRDGVDLEPRTATVAEELVAGLLPFSEEEFYSLVYLDSRRASSLLSGSSSARQNYLVGLLRIDEFDRIREYVKGQLAGMDRLGAQRDEASAMLAELPDIDPDAVRKNLKKGERLLNHAKVDAKRGPCEAQCTPAVREARGRLGHGRQLRRGRVPPHAGGRAGTPPPRP